MTAAGTGPCETPLMKNINRRGGGAAVATTRAAAAAVERAVAATAEPHAHHVARAKLVRVRHPRLAARPNEGAA